MATLDKGPLLPPFPSKLDSIDCHSLNLTNIEDRGGEIDFVFEAQQSIEYPPEYLPHFISIKVETDPVVMRYSGDQIKNVARDDHRISFTVEHTFAGQSKITTQCLHNKQQSITKDLKDVVLKKPEYSTSDHPGTDHAKFHDVCLEYEKFLYFIPIYGDRPSVPFDNDNFRFEMLRWPILNGYLDHKKVKHTMKTCFLVAPFPTEAWKTVLVSLIPLTKSVVRNEPNPDKVLIVFRKTIPDNANQVLKFLSPNAPVKLDDIMCFETLLMTSTYSDRVNSNQIQDALNGFIDDVPLLRQKIGLDQTKKKKIIITDTLYPAIYDPIKQKFADCEIVELSQSGNIQEIIHQTSESQILIGDHISSLIHMAWLGSAKSAVIDVSHADYACNPWFKNVADSLNISYYRTQKCNNACNDFSCYPSTDKKYNIDIEKIIKIISEIIGE
ncbi:hypothetical protein GPJ56_010611 [Histomonas meleagridis]|uniref:uncharacterized protein n=1 Tax=Histomonas meleagridis TaxID=135588 RepID=UPI00355AB03D|nr:hypothetical protein GPJ56_010611 [Histomonas meleagridis]KAH0804006.1 hypothetical protein GO595_002836 [Histomonas meleagridis]